MPLTPVPNGKVSQSYEGLEGSTVTVSGVTGGMGGSGVGRPDGMGFSPDHGRRHKKWGGAGEKPDSAPKRHKYRGMAAISCRTPVFVAGPDGAGDCPAASIVSRPFPVRVSPASGEKRPRFGRVASWSRFFAALLTPRRLLPDIGLRGVP